MIIVPFISATTLRRRHARYNGKRQTVTRPNPVTRKSCARPGVFETTTRVRDGSPQGRDPHGQNDRDSLSGLG